MYTSLSQLIFVVLVLFSCKRQGPVASLTKSLEDKSTSTVLVVDQGFDPENVALKGKVKASYTLSCSPPRQDSCSECPYEEFKKASLQALKQVETCQVEKGIKLAIDPAFDGIMKYRKHWNESILQKNAYDPAEAGDTSLPNSGENQKSGPQAESSDPFEPLNLASAHEDVAVPDQQVADEITRILLGNDHKYSYHGTMTAGLIAYKNPDVKLVLVQIKMSSSNQVKDVIACLSKRAYQNQVRLLKDEDYQKAYLEAPESAQSRLLSALIKEHGVSIINFSAGPLPRVIEESSLKEKNCPVTDLRERYQLLVKLQEKKTARSRQSSPQDAGPLLVQAAGNEGVVIDSAVDGDCHDLSSNRILVGSYNNKMQMSEISQRGKCVDVYSLGEWVVLAEPRGFVNAASGTSFSAPLVVRYLTLNAKGKDPQKMIADLFRLRDPKSFFLPASTWPKELALNNREKISSYGLTVTKADTDRTIRLYTPRDFRPTLFP